MYEKPTKKGQKNNGQGFKPSRYTKIIYARGDVQCNHQGLVSARFPGLSSRWQPNTSVNQTPPRVAKLGEDGKPLAAVGQSQKTRQNLRFNKSVLCNPSNTVLTNAS